MNIEELKRDLLSKSNDKYFTKKLFKKDEKIYGRRSFDDLFKYYRRRGVTELLLMKGLVETGFSARLCNTKGLFVFFKYYTNEREEDSIFLNNRGHSILYDDYSRLIKDTKYTKEYLMNLYKKVV